MAGSVPGFFTRACLGCRGVDYWLHPLLQTVGPASCGPTLPLALLLLPTTYTPAAFIVGFGAWFPPMATIPARAYAPVRRDYIDMARTLSRLLPYQTSGQPSALPDAHRPVHRPGKPHSPPSHDRRADWCRRGPGLWCINWVKGWATISDVRGPRHLVTFLRPLMVLLFKIRSLLVVCSRTL